MVAEGSIPLDQLLIAVHSESSVAVDGHGDPPVVVAAGRSNALVVRRLQADIELTVGGVNSSVSSGVGVVIKILFIVNIFLGVAGGRNIEADPSELVSES